MLDSLGHAGCAQDSIMYWPGGGGALTADAMPANAYMSLVSTLGSAKSAAWDC